jgi:hypothetical protein
MQPTITRDAADTFLMWSFLLLLVRFSVYISDEMKKFLIACRRQTAAHYSDG